MSDYIDTREGWRELDLTDQENARFELAEYYTTGRLRRAWVREEPLPPLPTEPFSVIRVTWKVDDGTPTVLVLDDSATRPQWGWSTTAGADPCGGESWVRRHISGFEVLAEPLQLVPDGGIAASVRRETAKAVLDRVRTTGLWQLLIAAHPANGAELDDIAREFGVES